jgi:aspartyl-tRNA(Asn)/glutamyl-tRNA(Gln) amidotransferase subunit A
MLIPYKNYQEKIQMIKNGELDLVENVRFFLSNIEQKKELNAFNFVFADEAVTDARRIAEKIKNGKHGKLAGMVVAVKDVLSVKENPLPVLQKFSKILPPSIQQRQSKNLLMKM